jgi:hypothetical protein
MTKITQLDTEIIIAIAIIAVGGVKVTYAGIAPGARFLVSDALKEPHSSQKRHATRMFRSGVSAYLEAASPIKLTLKRDFDMLSYLTIYYISEKKLELL